MPSEGSDSNHLTDLFLRCLPAQLRPAFAATPKLESRLRQVASNARSAWPGIEVDDSILMEKVAAFLGQERESADPNAHAIDVPHAGDLYLAAACGAGDAKALAAFENAFIADVPRALSRFSPHPDFVEEAKQRLREKLFIGTKGRPPRILEYAGRGPLGAWVRIAALRTAITMRRSKARTHQDLGTPDDLASPATGPELAVVRGQRRLILKHAIQSALGALQPDERELLRMHVLKGLTVAEIGARVGVHASTVSRRIAKSRTAVLAYTKHELVRVGLARDEVESLVENIGERLDLSLQRVLGETEGHDPASR